MIAANGKEIKHITYLSENGIFTAPPLSDQYAQHQGYNRIYSAMKKDQNSNSALDNLKYYYSGPYPYDPVTGGQYANRYWERGVQNWENSSSPNYHKKILCEPFLNTTKNFVCNLTKRYGIDFTPLGMALAIHYPVNTQKPLYAIISSSNNGSLTVNTSVTSNNELDIVLEYQRGNVVQRWSDIIENVHSSYPQKSALIFFGKNETLPNRINIRYISFYNESFSSVAQTTYIDSNASPTFQNFNFMDFIANIRAVERTGVVSSTNSAVILSGRTSD